MRWCAPLFTLRAVGSAAYVHWHRSRLDAFGSFINPFPLLFCIQSVIYFSSTNQAPRVVPTSQAAAPPPPPVATAFEALGDPFAGRPSLKPHVVVAPSPPTTPSPTVQHQPSPQPSTPMEEPTPTAPPPSGSANHMQEDAPAASEVL